MVNSTQGQFILNLTVPRHSNMANTELQSTVSAAKSLEIETCHAISKSIIKLTPLPKTCEIYRNIHLDFLAQSTGKPVFLRSAIILDEMTLFFTSVAMASRKVSLDKST